MKFGLSFLVCICMCLSMNCAGADSGTVTGRLLLSNGKPLAGGQVFFFDVNSPLEKPFIGRFWRVPDAVDHVDNDGRFTLQLEAGSYYFGAIKRSSADRFGPPETGDYFLPSRDKRGNYRVITVNNKTTTDIGSIGGIRRYSQKRAATKDKATVIEGRITMASGQPAQNMFVLAYTDPAMQGRPSFVSGASDMEGRYQLHVDKGRIFYLKVRDKYAGGRPQPGSLLGVYGSMEEPSPVKTQTDSTTSDIDIQVDAFTGRRQ